MSDSPDNSLPFPILPGEDYPLGRSSSTLRSLATVRMWLIWGLIELMFERMNRIHDHLMPPDAD